MFGLSGARWFFIRCREWLQAAQRAREQRGREAIQKARAERKALSLLLGLLNQEQRHDFHECGYFHVTGASSGDRYRIRVDSAVNIDVLGDDGAIKYHLCARPSGNIPMYDVMAAQLLYLQDRESESRFLQRANRHVRLSFAAMGRWEER